MRYSDLADDMTVPNRWHLGELVYDGKDVSGALWVGRRFEGATPLDGKVDREGRELDFCRSSFAVPVAGGGVAQTIATVAGSSCQRIPVRLPGHDGFEVLNSLRVVKCLDEQHSEFIKWTDRDHRADLAGQYRMVTQLKILPDQVPRDASFFRVEGWLIALIVSETVKMAMEQVGCVGATFVEVT
jgi:hypothetical protein